MTTAITLLATTNNVIIMLALGLARPSATSATKWPLLLRSALGYNLLVPAIGLGILCFYNNDFSAETLLAMACCILAAGGTSAGAIASRLGASPSLTANLLLLLPVVGLLTMAILSVVLPSILAEFAANQMASPLVHQMTSLLAESFRYLLLITVAPFGLAKILSACWPQLCGFLQQKLEKLGSLLLVALIAALLWRYGIDIICASWQPLTAAIFMVGIFLLPALIFEPWLWQSSVEIKRSLVLTSLVRNLTLVLAMVTAMPDAQLMLPTVLAFGLLMYLTCGVLFWRWHAN